MQQNLRETSQKPHSGLAKKICLPLSSNEDGDGSGHHDALVITLSIGNCTIKKALVDNGSSVNLIMLETLKNMGFSEADLRKKAIPLVGFSGRQLTPWEK